MTRPHPVLTPLSPAAIFLVATIDDGGEPPRAHSTLTDLSALVRGVAFRVPSANLTLVTGIGSDAWDRLFAGAAQPNCTPSSHSTAHATALRPHREICCGTSVADRWMSASNSDAGSWTRRLAP